MDFVVPSVPNFTDTRLDRAPLDHPFYDSAHHKHSLGSRANTFAAYDSTGDPMATLIKKPEVNRIVQKTTVSIRNSVAPQDAAMGNFVEISANKKKKGKTSKSNDKRAARSQSIPSPATNYFVPTRPQPPRSSAEEPLIPREDHPDLTDSLRASTDDHDPSSPAAKKHSGPVHIQTVAFITQQILCPVCTGAPPTCSTIINEGHWNGCFHNNYGCHYWRCEYESCNARNTMKVQQKFRCKECETPRSMASVPVTLWGELIERLGLRGGNTKKFREKWEKVTKALAPSA